MDNYNSENKSSTIDNIRGLNFFGALVFLFASPFEGLGYLIVYYLVFIYVWLYLLFLISEVRFIISKKINLVKHVFSHWLIFLGLIIPILTVIMNRVFF